MEGVVVRFRSDQGYGFIRPDNGAPELFVHVSEVLGGRPPEVGRRVSFVPVETPKGWQARSVVPGSRQRSPKVVEELIPEAQQAGNTDLATMATLTGFSIMMVLDVALG